MEADLASIAAAVRAVLARNDADAPFHTSVEAPASAEPPLFLKFPSLFRFVAGPGQDNALDTQLCGDGLIVRGMHAAVAAGLPRRMMSVCGSKMLTSFSAAGTDSSSCRTVTRAVCTSRLSTCPLCNTAVVFDATAGDMQLDFGTTGRLRFSNFLMYHRQTESWWQQAWNRMWQRFVRTCRRTSRSLSTRARGLRMGSR